MTCVCFECMCGKAVHCGYFQPKSISHSMDAVCFIHKLQDVFSVTASSFRTTGGAKASGYAAGCRERQRRRRYKMLTMIYIKYLFKIRRRRRGKTCLLNFKVKDTHCELAHRRWETLPQHRSENSLFWSFHLYLGIVTGVNNVCLTSIVLGKIELGGRMKSRQNTKFIGN